MEFHAKCIQPLKDLGRKIQNRRSPGSGIKLLLPQELGKFPPVGAFFHGSEGLYFALPAGLVSRRLEDLRLNSPHKPLLLRLLPCQDRAGETVLMGKAAAIGAKYRYFAHGRKSPLALPKL